ncbi:hypothetical protein ASC80_05660 [Afipia sp. Root123D2]|nr:hypothetical protein ASC80_05660 [Afipia sp. Root123D2]
MTHHTLRSFLIAAIIVQSSAAYAETTVCYGDGKCTIVTSSGSRQMSQKEEIAHRRDQQRGRVENIECPTARSPAQCEQLKNELYRLFNWLEDIL